ncbi:MAG: group II truncated hemoglobin [Novosphingobium sp.]|nr:group II truncated hemoglobin [Novosphingobium sp.]
MRSRHVSTQAHADAPAATPYERIGGSTALRRLTDRFYDLMDTDPAFAALRAMHAADLLPMRESLPEFLAGWCGGPRRWAEANPGKCMMSLHKPFPISGKTAGQWADCMTRAIADSALEDSEIANALADVLTRMALGMAREGMEQH